MLNILQTDRHGNIIMTPHQWNRLQMRLDLLERKTALILDRLHVYMDTVPAHDVLIDRVEVEE